MITQELLDYIKGELAKDVEKDTIIKALVTNGWLPQDINDALATLLPTPTPQPPSPKAPEPVAEFVVPTVFSDIPSITQTPIESPVVVAPIESPVSIPSQTPSTLAEKVMKIETIYDTTINKVTELGGEQRQVFTDSIKGLEQRKLDEVKKRLGMP